jgi:putative alpha-1,2-mannosidase
VREQGLSPPHRPTAHLSHTPPTLPRPFPPPPPPNYSRRQPSPWISSYGDFRIAATISDPSHSDSWQFSSYDPTQSSFLPYYFNASLQAYGNGLGETTTVELTSTNHAAVLRVRFPSFVSGETNSGFNQTRRILVSTYGSLGDSANFNGASITGISTMNNGGVTGNFAHYFNLTIFGGENGDVDVTSAIIGSGTGQNDGAYAYLDFDPTVAASDVLTLRVGTSFISAAQASLNLATDVGMQSFDQVQAAAKAEWNTLFSRVTVVDVGEAWYTPAEKNAFLTTFYSALYRASQFPRFLDEETPQGTMHYSAYDPTGAVHPGPIVADLGFWDAYRTSATWASLWTPDVLARQLTGWNNAYLEGE